MNQKNSLSIYEHRLQRRGGGYLVFVQSLELVKSFLLLALGVIYVLTIASFNPIQTQQLIVSTAVLTAIYSLLILLFTAMASVYVRMRLNHKIRSTPLPADMNENELETRAWQEVINFPGRLLAASLATAYLVVVLPVVIFMIRSGGAKPMQAVYVAIGGIISTTFFAIQNVFAMDRNIESARQILIPSDFKKRSSVTGLRVRTRMLIVVAGSIISAAALLAPLGYQALVNVTGDAVSPTFIRTYLENTAVVLVILVIFGIIISGMLSKSITDPLDELSRTISEIGKENLNSRAKIKSSDETLLLNINLNNMIEQLQESRASLMRQVAERTSDLTRRTEELQAAAQVAREAASQQDVNQLLERTVNMISSRFGFYHTAIFLLNETRDYAVLRAASSDDGKKMVEKGHRLAVGQQGIVGAAAYQNRPRVAMDVGSDAVYFHNPDLPLTRAEAAFPLSVRNEVIGVLDIQSTSIDAFSKSDMDLLQTLADQIALAIQNARLLEESRINLRQQEATNVEAVRRIWADRSRMQKKDYYYSTGGTRQPKTSGKPMGIGNRLNIPISLRGQRIGNISLSRAGDMTWSEEDRSLAIEVSNQIGLALENARLLDEAQRRAAQEQAISELAAKLGRSVDPDSLLQAAVRELHLLPNVEEVSVYIGTGDDKTPPNGTE